MELFSFRLLSEMSDQGQMDGSELAQLLQNSPSWTERSALIGQPYVSHKWATFSTKANVTSAAAAGWNKNATVPRSHAPRRPDAHTVKQVEVQDGLSARLS